MKVASNILATEKELSKLGINLTQLTEDLTLPNPEYANQMRFGRGRFYKKIDKYICYLKKDGDQYLVPRYYAGELDGTYGNSGRELTSKHSIKLRDYQESFFNDNWSTIENTTGLLIEASCGMGKTIMGIWLAYYRGVQTMVLVPTYYLAKQWKQRIEAISNATCSIIKSTDTEIPTYNDFTIIVTDLFNCRILPTELVNNVGHVILDEAHRMGADTYLPILDEIPARFRTALTATFRRTDGVHKILKFHFGSHIKLPSCFPRPLAYGLKTGISIQGCVSKNKPYEYFLDFMEVNYKDTFEKLQETPGAIVYDSKQNNKLREIADKEVKLGIITKTQHKQICSCLRKGGEMSYPTVESFLNENAGRRKIVIKLIQECMDAGRTVLFLSKRKDTLKALHKHFSEYNPMLIVSETNSRSEEDEKYLQTKCPLIFGVNQLAKEGLDIDRLDTLIIHLPMADTEQAIGRISRLCEGKKQPIAFYLVDKCPLTFATFSKAKKTFAINANYKGDITLAQVFDKL